ncbi:hypothetical protein Tco_0993368 [Tanacetum coccineum]|uniref:Uncharacterized protein n=1 Tax=Tanacetum coccineum TaxID=301880 RepID=A0ABQ5F5J3_9ASTR
MVEKRMRYIGLMRWLDQGVKMRVCVSVCNLNVVRKKVNSEYVAKNVLIGYGRSLDGNEGDIRMVKPGIRIWDYRYSGFEGQMNTCAGWYVEKHDHYLGLGRMSCAWLEVV